jgi:hypothetical protein
MDLAGMVNGYAHIGHFLFVGALEYVSRSKSKRCPMRRALCSWFSMWPRSSNSRVLTLPVMEQTGKIWGRTGCNFNEAGLGSCATGDCGGQLQCKVGNAIPVTSIGYQLYGYPVLGYDNTDYIYVSLAEGFNLPMSVGPLTPSTKSKCNPVACKKDINVVCPPELKVNGGFRTGCGVFPSNDLYCCKGDYAQQCPANNYTKFFKSQCPESIGYGFENQ